MARLYLRQAIVEISNELGSTRIFNGLRTIYDIEKTSVSSANKGKIEIWNLAAESRSFIEGVNKGDTLKTTLNAGYVDFVERIYSGNISKAKSEFKPPNWITTLELGDGEKKLRETHLDRSFPPGTPFQTIILQIAQSFGFAAGPQVALVPDISRNGESYSGSSKDILDGLAKRFAFDWSVQDGALQIVPFNIATPETAVQISSDTGLIANAQQTDKTGVEFRCLMIPQIKPGRFVFLESTGASGFFKVRKVQFKGDTHGGDHSAMVEAATV